MLQYNKGSDFMKSLEQLMDAHHQYFNTQQTRSYSFRRRQLKALYLSIQNHSDEIEEALYLDLGKSKFESYSTEISQCLNAITYTLKHLKKWMRPKKYLPPIYLFGSYDVVTPIPYGTTLIIGPFNYPFQLVMIPLIGAIAAGNTTIIKPSELAMHTATIIEKIINETFVNDYITCVQGDKETTIALTHLDIQHIFFTGSITVGKSIQATASQKLIPTVLELGGKSPVIVDETANLKEAVKKIAWAKSLNSGQTCIAPDYLIIHESIKDKFIEHWKEITPVFYKEQACIINEHHFHRLTSPLIKETILSGGRYDDKTRKIELTLVDGKYSSYMEDEIFGPILPVYTYTDLTQVVSISATFPHPLACYIFSEKQQTIDYLTTRIPFGGGCINDCISHILSSKVPFGGFLQSGLGHYHGKYSFDAFSHYQTLHYRKLKKDIVSLMPPYSKIKYQLVKKFVK